MNDTSLAEAVSRRSLALVNPKSANSASQTELLQAFEQSGGAVHVTSNPRELQQTISDAAAERNRLIMVGGDGSIAWTVNALGRAISEFELAVIPAGTGNDFARSLALPLDDPQLAWTVALQEQCQGVDLIELSGVEPQFFVNAVTAGFGLRQASEAAAEQKSSWGRIAYWLAAASQLGDMPQFDLTLRWEGEERLVPCLGFWLANGRYTGGGFPISSDALLDDGMLDVVVVPSMPVLELLSAGVDLTLAGPEYSDQILTFRTAELSLAAKPEMPLSIDGEPMNCGALECRVLEQVLRIAAGNLEPALKDSGATVNEK